MAAAWGVKCAVIVALLTGVMFMWEVAADSSIQNLSKASVSVDSHTLDAGNTLIIAIRSGNSGTTIDFSYVKNITKVSIKNNKEYFVVENHAGTKGILKGKSVVTLDLTEANILESAF